jgi:hypothetical protein
MSQEPFFIQMSISHYGAMLKLNLDDEDRATLTRLLVDAERRLVIATTESDTEA